MLWLLGLHLCSFLGVCVWHCVEMVEISDVLEDFLPDISSINDESLVIITILMWHSARFQEILTSF
jgi:hypothetical protein